MKTQVIFVLLFLITLIHPIAAQQAALPCDSVVVTCEGFNDADYVLAIMNVNGIATLAAPSGQNWSTPAASARHNAGSTQFTRKNLGQVFGLCYNNIGDIFVAATSIYNTDAQGSINNMLLTSNGNPANSGSIYKITATGVTEFADLPNQGQGLGNICYDRWHDKIIATNFFDGLIYIIDATNGTNYTTFNPNFDGYNTGTAGGTNPVFARLGQRPWGIAAWGTNANDAKLYYSCWSADNSNIGTGRSNTIWSVNLNSAGMPTGSESLLLSIPYLGATHIGLGNYSNPVADIEISNTGLRMLLAERTIKPDDPSCKPCNAHRSRLIELTRSSQMSALWSNQPYSKFNVGTLTGIHCTGGTDYGEFDLTPATTVPLACDSSIWVMSDYMQDIMVSNKYAYGVQILPSLGGSVASSKVIDLNGNLALGDDKSSLGDVDFRKCLNCPVIPQNCNFYRPAPVDSICCQAGLVATQTSGIPAISSISYSISGGVIQGFTSSCIIANPTSYSGTSVGTVTFTGLCSNMQFITASLAATSATGNITVTWTINFSNGTTCTYVSKVEDCPHAVVQCDSFYVKPCICPGSTLSFLDIKVFNQIVPNDPICKVKIEKFDIFGNLQSNPWTTGAMVTPIVPFASPYSNIPSSGPSLNVTTNNVVNAQVFFPQSPYPTGSIKITAYHCNGDSCVYSWRFNPILPSSSADVAVIKTRTAYTKYYVAAFKLKAKNLTQRESSISYFTIGIDEVSGEVAPEIVAITGAQLYRERGDRKSVSLPLSASAHARENALFELLNPFSVSDSSQLVHIVFGGALPRKLQTALYDKQGNVLGIDALQLDSLTTSTGIVLGFREEAPIFLVSGAPNPVKDIYTVKLFTDGSRDISLNVYDISGKLILQTLEGRLSTGFHERSIFTSQLSSGTYFAKIESSDKIEVLPLKFVVVR